MNKRTVILILITFLLLNTAELMLEKKLIHKKTINNFKINNLFINYSFKKVLEKKEKKYKPLFKTFFKLYPGLYFAIIKKGDQIIFTAGKSIKYNVLLASFINTLKSNKKIKNNFTVNDNNFYFNNSGVGEHNIITGFKYDIDFSLRILRNFIITLLLAGLLIFILKKNKKPLIKEYSQHSTDDDNSRAGYISEKESYKNLHEDNQKLVEQLENLSTFREVGLAINSILNFSQMLHVIMGVVISKMGVQKIIIYFIDEQKKELIAKIGREGDQIIPEDGLTCDKIILSEGPLGKAMEYHTSIISSESSSENLLLCPLMAQGDLIGAIKIANKLDNKIFQDTDKSLLNLLSSQIAIALNNARLYEMAITDGLTKLYVHRHFQFRLQDELLRHKRGGKTLSLIMIDIDHFKDFNDNYGHQTGDFVLKEIAKILKSMFRTTDSTFRYGGEEMAVILPETDAESAFLLAEKLRKEIEDHKFDHNGDDLQVTISLGISTYYPQKTASLSKEELIKMADKAMYYSKENGRNCTTPHESIKEDKEIVGKSSEEAIDSAGNTDQESSERNPLDCASDSHLGGDDQPQARDQEVESVL